MISPIKYSDYFVNLSELGETIKAEITFYIQDYDKFCNLTIKELLAPYFETKNKKQ